MKTYHLLTIVGDSVMETKLQAEYLDTTTFNSTSSGYYEFKDDKGQVVACYPINRTIISKIEENK
jgi:hypothetical protein